MIKIFQYNNANGNVELNTPEIISDEIDSIPNNKYKKKEDLETPSKQIQF